MLYIRLNIHLSEDSNYLLSSIAFERTLLQKVFDSNVETSSLSNKNRFLFKDFTFLLQLY